MGSDEKPTDYQTEILLSLWKHHRMAVRAGHGSGKTTTAAWATLWFALTREALGIDWKVITTASAWRQLTHYLWPEIHKWALRLNWSKVGRGDFIPKDELSTQRIALKYGSAFPVASNRSDLIEGAHASHLLYIFDESKRLDISTPIPTPTGWTTMGDLTVGDMVLGECGKPTKVTYVSPIVRDRPCCRITFEDGAEVIADPGHLWAALSYRKRQIWGARHTNDPRYRREYARVRDWRGFWDKADVVETSDLLAQRYAVPTCYPLDLPEQELPIDPYTLGAWLGDGPSLHAAIASMDSEILERIASAGHELTQRTFLTHNKAQTYGIVRGGLHRALRLNGLFGNKHIPQIYLRASYAQRLELLRGLMDTDGTVMGGRARRDSRVSFTSVEKQLVDDVAELARTFGWKVAVSEFEAKIGDVSYGAAYIIRWSADVCPFHLRRKAEKWVAREAQASASTIRSIKSIESVPSVPTRCISVDSERHLYLCGEHFIPTHNSIPDPTWISAEGAMVSVSAWWLAISTPGDPIGKFYDIHVRKEGTEDWHVRHVKMEEALAAGRLSEKWIEDRKREWGEKSSTFKNRVLGEFAEGEIDSLIPLSWIEAAFERWREWAKNFEKEKVALESDQLGVDVARGGGDMSVVAHRKGYAITLLQKYNFDDTMVLTGHVAPYLTISGTASAVVDVVGWGAGVYDRLSEQFGDRIFSFHPQGVPDMMDATGLWGFKDNYSAAWWNMRELLDPNNPRKLSEAVIIQPDDKLKEELVAVKWKATSSGKIEVQPKEKTKEAIGRSPDTADAVVMAYWLPAQHGIDFA